MSDSLDKLEKELATIASLSDIVFFLGESCRTNKVMHNALHGISDVLSDRHEKLNDIFDELCDKRKCDKND